MTGRQHMTIEIDRRRALASALALAAGPWLAPARAQGAFPNQPIKFIIPTAVGGGYDIMMRA